MVVETFTDLVNAVVKKTIAFTVGTIKTVDEAEMTCVVTPEDGGQDIEDIPLRIMRYPNAIGFTIIPVINTEVIVAWLGERRPVIFRIHEWDKVIIQDEDGHGIIIKKGEILLGVEASAIHPVAWGDIVMDYFGSVRTAILGLGGALGPPPSMSSTKVKVS